jgi:hypothetical protein
MRDSTTLLPVPERPTAMLALVFAPALLVIGLRVAHHLRPNPDRRARAELRWSREDDRALAAFLDDAPQ